MAFCSHGIYSLVCSFAGKIILSMAPSSSDLSSQRPQGNFRHCPSDGASISTHSRNQPVELPVVREITVNNPQRLY